MSVINTFPEAGCTRGASVSIHVCTPNSTGLIPLTLENTAVTRWLNVSGIH